MRLCSPLRHAKGLAIDGRYACNEKNKVQIQCVTTLNIAATTSTFSIFSFKSITNTANPKYCSKNAIPEAQDLSLKVALSLLMLSWTTLSWFSSVFDATKGCPMVPYSDADRFPTRMTLITKISNVYPSIVFNLVKNFYASVHVSVGFSYPHDFIENEFFTKK